LGCPDELAVKDAARRKIAIGKRLRCSRRQEAPTANSAINRLLSEVCDVTVHVVPMQTAEQLRKGRRRFCYLWKIIAPRNSSEMGIADCTMDPVEDRVRRYLRQFLDSFHTRCFL